MSYYVPVEVLEQIISYLEPIHLTKSHRGPAWRGDVLLRKTLTALAMASRTCRRLAEPYLYGAIDIDGFLDSYGSLKLLMRTFMRRRDLALHVRRIRVGDFVPDPTSSSARVISVNLNSSEALTPIALWTEKTDITLDATSYNDLLRDKGHFSAIKFLDGSYTLGARHGVRQEMLYLLFILCTALEDLELSLSSLGRFLNHLSSLEDGSSILPKLKHLYLLRTSDDESGLGHALKFLASRGSLVTLRIDNAQNSLWPWKYFKEPLQLRDLRIDGTCLNQTSFDRLAREVCNLQSLELYDHYSSDFPDLQLGIESVIARRFPELQRLTLMPRSRDWVTSNLIGNLKSMAHLKHLHLNVSYLCQEEAALFQPVDFREVLPTSLQSLRISQCKDYRVPCITRFTTTFTTTEYSHATCGYHFGERLIQLLSNSSYAALDQITIETCLHLRAQNLDPDGLSDPHYCVTMQDINANIAQSHWQDEVANWSRVRDFSRQHGWTAAFHEVGVVTIRRCVRNSS